MLKNYLKIAVRYLWRNRLYTSINMAGLAIGMACALLAILYVHDEMSYDRFHEKASQLYRLTTTITNQDGTQQMLGTTGQVEGPAFKTGIPEILDYARILGMDGINMSNGGKSFGVKNLFVDESFFNLFSFPLLYGNPKTILNDPFSVVLSETTALKFFGTTDVIGRSLKIEEGRGIDNLTITGVAKNAPTNSSIQFDVLVPFKYFQLMFTDKNWLNQYLTTFILLHPAANTKIVEQKFARVFEKNTKEQSFKSINVAGQYKFGLLPISNIHLHPLGLNSYVTTDEEQGLTGGSTITYSYVLMGIVAFILLMACVNFINLSISGSLTRAKEIGVRKISGSSRRQIVFQFLVEAAILCLISYILAILLCKLVLPVFNQLANKQLSLSYLQDVNLFIYGAILMITCIFLAGLYPAISLSLFNPVRALYNKQKLHGKNLFGKSLVVLQFTLAAGLTISTIIYYRQMNFISDEDLGYNAADIIKIHLPPQRLDVSTVNITRNRLLKDPSVKQITSDMGISAKSVFANGKKLVAKGNAVDEFYLQTFEISLKQGRNFSGEFGTDSVNSVIVNETLVKSAGWKNPVGQQLTDLDDNHTKTIIGVVKDYHFGSFKEKIEPLVLSMGNRENILVKIQKGKMIQALKAIEATYKKIFPQHYFYYKFLDDEIAGSYQNDRRWQQIITYSSILAIMICCIGLFGLSRFSAKQRIKEIGIRKVLGASVANIIGVMTKDFLKLVTLAIVIAFPVAWYTMSSWLQNFAYKTGISPGIFIFTGLLMVMIALVTISFQAVKAAIANPVESLRSE